MSRISFTLPALLALSALALAGCKSSSEPVEFSGPIEHRLATPTQSGKFKNVDHDRNVAAGGLVINPGYAHTGSGFAYAVGYQEGSDGFAAFAGILPDTDLDAVPTSGHAVMRGLYEVSEKRAIDIVDGKPDGDTYTHKGGMVVLVEFSDASVHGFSSDGRLTVDGKIHGNGSFTGESTFRGTDGDLTGVVDADLAVGAVAGKSDDHMYAGGFIALK